MMPTQIRVSGRDDVAEGLRRGWQLPSYLYSDPEVFDLEKEHIFRRSWQFICTRDQLQNTGDYVTGITGDIPVLVTRTKDGTLKGFVNACLHRLHPVAKDAGCKKILQCSYHGWTYDLDGALKTAPRSKDDRNFDKSDMNLSPVKVEAFGNFVFVNADHDAPSLSENFGDAANVVPSLGIDFVGWERASTFTYDVAANWKLFMENSLECYHCDLVHGDTFGDAFVTDPGNYICDNYENVLTQIAPMGHPPLAEKRAVEELEKFRLLYVWPSTAVSIDEYAGTITRLIPLGVKRCRFIVDVYARPGIDQEILDSWLDMYDKTFNEDKVVVVAQQAGYDSGRVARGRLLPNNESSISMFQRRTWAALQPVIEGSSHE